MRAWEILHKQSLEYYEKYNKSVDNIIAADYMLRAVLLLDIAKALKQQDATEE